MVDCNFYRMFYTDLVNFSNEDLNLHYEYYGKKEGRFACEEDFFNKYPHFDFEFYKNTYNDVKSLNKYQLMVHYHVIGHIEDRRCYHTSKLNYDLCRMFYPDIASYSNEIIDYHYANFGKKEEIISCEEDFFRKYPHFDFEFYKNSYDDLKSLTKTQLMKHYHFTGHLEGRKTHETSKFNYELYKMFYSDIKERNFSNELIDFHYASFGKKEGRLCCEDDFFKKYPDFDISFYSNNYHDVNTLNKYELMAHYYLHGQYEFRLIKELPPNFEDDFYNTYPDFDINYYKEFNSELANRKKLDLLFHYQTIGYKSNDVYFNYDFIVNDDYTLPHVSDYLKYLIYSQYDFRTIDTNEKLIEYRNKFEKKFYIYNKKSFYDYYDDFDFDFYKNKYFLNNDCEEKEILLYYHTTGKYKKDIINKKIKIIMYTLPLNIKCGGLLVMHYFLFLINKFYSDKFIGKLFMHNNIKYKNKFCNNFAKIDEVENNTIVIYPEIISGNPLNAKNVVRWILLELGIEMPLDHYKKWNTSDLIYHWEKIDKQLTCPFFNNIFKNNNLQNRTKTCFLVKKGHLIHKNLYQIHPSNSICIDNLSLEEINLIFNECKYFYSYDPNTAYIIYAAVCGCIPIICEIEGVSEENYFKEKIYTLENKIYNKGIVYGINIDKIINILENRLNENNEEYYNHLFEAYAKKTIPCFLEEIENYLLNN